MEWCGKNRKPLVYVLCVAVLMLMFTLPIIAGHDGAAWGQVQKKGQLKPNVFTPHGQPIGSVGSDGNIYALHGNVIGSVDSSGTIYNVSKVGVGSVSADGKVSNQSGQILCTVDSNGNVYNVSGLLIGSVKETGGNITLIGGAARLLVLTSGK